MVSSPVATRGLRAHGLTRAEARPHPRDFSDRFGAQNHYWRTRTSNSDGQSMIRRKINVPVKIVWRMTAVDPVGVDIDLTEPRTTAMAPQGLPDGGWLESSRDLLHGLRVRETPMDTLSEDLVKAFTRTKR